MTHHLNLKTDFVLQIPWDFSNGRTYKYGAKISSSVESTVYSNPMMAQAVKIHTWYSETTYPNDRFSPTLPLLKANHSYALIAYYKAKPEKSIFIQIDIFDPYGQLIDSVIDVAGEIVFEFPKDASSYQVSLINASNEWLHFNQLLIFETTPDLTTYYFDLNEKLFLSINDHEKSIIAFQNYQNQRLSLPNISDDKVKVIGDPTLNFNQLNAVLINDDSKVLFSKLLSQIKGNGSEVTFVGYHLFDSIVALLMAQLYIPSKVKVCQGFNELVENEKRLSSEAVAKILALKAKTTIDISK